jgi:hypothetical protein
MQISMQAPMHLIGSSVRWIVVCEMPGFAPRKRSVIPWRAERPQVCKSAVSVVT